MFFVVAILTKPELSLNVQDNIHLIKIMGYSIPELKEIINFAKERGYNDNSKI